MKTIIIGVFLREQSALSEYFLEMAEVFIKLGYKVIIISDENRQDIVNINSNPIILTWPSYHPNKWQDFVFIRKIIIEYSPQILIGNFTSVNLFLIAGMLYKVPFRISWIHSISAAFAEIPYWRTFRKRFVYKFATNIIVNSRATEIDAINTFGVNKNKITLLPNLIKNNDQYLTNNKNDNILFVGRFHKSKGIDVLLKALVLVKKRIPKIQLIIIAGGNDSKYLEMVKTLGLINNVTFLGKQPRKNVIKAFAEARISVVPSYYEAFGYTVIESLSVKTPVIGSNTGGISEIIEDKKNGLLFPVGDFKSLAEKIYLLLTDINLYNKIAEESFITFKNNYSLENNIKEHAIALDILSREK